MTDPRSKAIDAAELSDTFPFVEQCAAYLRGMPPLQVTLDLIYKFEGHLQQKRQEQKAQRKHASNRSPTTLESAVLTIEDAFTGKCDRATLEGALLSLFKPRSPRNKPDPFDSDIWQDMKLRISQLVRLNTNDDEYPDHQVAVKGRAYLMVEDKGYIVEYFPLFAMLKSGWNPQEVVLNLGQDLFPNSPIGPYIRNGAYLFGIDFGDIPVHFVFLEKIGEADTVYMVTHSGWHLLGGIYRKEIMQSLILDCAFRSALDAPHKHGEIQFLRQLPGVGEQEDVYEEEDKAWMLTYKERCFIVSSGRALLREMGHVENAAMGLEQETAADVWKNGYEVGVAGAS